MKTSEEPIVVEQIIDAALNDVWRALTDIDQMRQWYFEEIPNFRPEVGFATEFDVQGEERVFRHLWTITDVSPDQRIVYDWRYDGFEGESVVEFELSAKGDRTQIRVTHSVTKDFPDDIPEFRRESGLAGWTYFLTERLPEFLADEDAS